MSSARPYSAYVREILTHSIGWGQIHTPENDLVEFQSSTLPINVQAQLVLGAIGGSELIKISRHTAVQGQDVLYQPLADANANSADFQSKNIINYVRSSKSMLGDYAINLDAHFDLQLDASRTMESVGDDNKPSPLSMSDDGKITVSLDTVDKEESGVEFEYVPVNMVWKNETTAIDYDKVFSFFPSKKLTTWEPCDDS